VNPIIERIELWNWEIHEHTVIAGLSPGFNLLFGESNAGKTSILRALKLAAYNQFDPRSIRVGAKTTIVEITTGRGVVRVERGKGVNVWTVTTAAGASIFRNIGTNPLPEAVAVLGLGMVTLGDIEVPVNIMDQLESHFLIAGMAGKDASGSVRAQVVDEVSGLSGIEGIIKDVSLDNYRWGREVKGFEDKAREMRGQMHDAALLTDEESRLDEARERIVKSAELKDAAETSEQLRDEHGHRKAEADGMAAALAGMPDVEQVRIMVNMAEKMLVKAKAVQMGHDLWVANIAAVKKMDDEAGLLPDPQEAEQWAAEADRLLRKSEGAAELFREAEGMKGAVVAGELDLAAAEGQETDLRAEEFGLMSTFGVCPLTMEPIGPECLKRVRIPVLDPKDVGPILREKGIDP
jgi:hypothetical protein